MPKTNGTTTQLGLAAALGDGSGKTAPERKLIDLKDIEGQITAPDESRYKKDEWAAFLQSVQFGGLDYDVILRPKPGNKYEIVDGRHRVLAHKLLRLDAVPATIRKDYNDKTAAIAEIRANDQRRASSIIQQARAWGAARNAGAPIDEIARQAGVSESTVRERIDLLLLPPALQARAGRDIRTDSIRELVEIAKAPLPEQLKKDALETAAKSRDSWMIVKKAQQALATQKTVWLDSDFTGDYYLAEDAKFIKALAAVPQVTIGDDVLLLDKPAAAKILADFKGKARATAPVGRSGKPQIDVKSRERNRVDRIQATLLVKVAKSRVSYGADFHKVLVLQWLRNLKMIGARKVDRALMAEVTGLTKWDGYGSSLAPAVEKAWGKAEAGRIMHMALYFETNARQAWQSGTGVPDPYAELLLGKSNKTLVAQAKREVAVELKGLKAKGKGKPKAGSKGAARVGLEGVGRHDPDEDDADEE